MAYKEWPEEQLVRMFLQRYGALETLQIIYILDRMCCADKPDWFIKRKLQTRNLFESQPGYLSATPVSKPRDSIVEAFWLLANYCEQINPHDTWVERDGIGFLMSNKIYHAIKVPYEGEYTMQYVNHEATENDSYIFILDDLDMMYKMPTIKPEHCYAMIERNNRSKYPKISYYSLDKASKKG